MWCFPLASDTLLCVDQEGDKNYTLDPENKIPGHVNLL